MSDVVVSLLMILLVLLAIGIVWVVVSGILKSGSEEVNISGLILDMKITDVKFNAYFQPDKLNVKVKRNPGEGDVSGIKFIFEGDDFVKEIERTVDINELDEKEFPFTDVDIFGSVKFGSWGINKISIIPTLISDSGKEKEGKVEDEVVLSCSDTENGYFTYFKGTITTSFGRYDDDCIGTELQEFGCLGKISSLDFVPCTSCLYGACV